MPTCKKLKNRLLRKYAKGKDVFLFVVGLFFMLCIGVGVVHNGRWSIKTISYCYHAYILDDINDAYNQSFDLNQDYRYYENGSHSYIRNKHTHEKVLQDICWIAGMEWDDSLLCFACDGYRGYFNRQTGKVAIPADRYKKAWLFSEGLAAVVDEDGTLKFINPEGEVMIDKHFRYAPSSPDAGYLFKNGYCPLQGINQRWGLIDHDGRWAAFPEYDRIEFANCNCWICHQDGRLGLLNDSLRLVLKPAYREVLVTDNGVEVLNEDYTRQLRDFEGNVIEPFLYTDVRELYYKSAVVDPSFNEYDYTLSSYKEYQTTYTSTGSVRVGLMDSDGHPVTPPLYTSITAVGADCFRCFLNEPDGGEGAEGASILINGEGHPVK